MPRKRAAREEAGTGGAGERAPAVANAARPPLEEYRRKRDFERTPEPPPRPRQPGRDLRFVIQQHDATRMHWDFRLEFGGVLVSWAVPKGPSYDSSQKRMAAHVEDHPIDYGRFEGVIPEGEYGAGPVIVWDQGTYSPDEGGRRSFGDPEDAERRMVRALEAGKISIFLRGQKLRGSWTLVRMAKSEKDWLLIKHRDRWENPTHDVPADDRSVLTYRTLDEVRRNVPAPELPFLPLPGHDLAAIPGARRSAFPTYPQGPMRAMAADNPFTNPEWWFELKLDGVRLLAFIRDGRVTLRSRNNRDVTSQFPTVAADLGRQLDHEMVLDGEVVAFDEQGRPDFETLATRIHLAGERKVERAEAVVPVRFQVFDLLYLDGFDFTQVPLYQRKALLRERLVDGDFVAFMDHVIGEGTAAFQFARERGLEGLVGKKRTGRYEPGMRSASWLKVKAFETLDLVVGGWSEGEGARRHTFGSLMVGYYDGDRLVYAGNVGSGFTERTLGMLKQRLEELAGDECPFAGPERVESPTRPHWVRPELTVEVKYANWTRDRRLRAPVFLRLREDAAPREVQAAEVLALPVSAPERSEADVDALIERLNNAGDEVSLTVQGHRIKLTNLDKEFWPAEGGLKAYTKRDLIRYYLQVAPFILPHLKDRPLTLTRYPEGIRGEHFYQKHWPHEIPAFVSTVRIWSSHAHESDEYILVQNLATLVWLEQLADLELHPWLSRVDPEPDATHLPRTFDRSEAALERSVLNYPDFMNFDLDPYIYSGEEATGAEPEYNRRAFDKLREIVYLLRETLFQLGLQPFVKTSGKTGLHVYVPVLRQYTFDEIRAACEAIGRFVMAQRPDEVTMEWAVSKRTGRIFIDHNMNTRGKNMASAYSLRPVPGAPASVPISWDELREIYPPEFTIETVPQRLQRAGDPWAGILEAKHDLRAVIEGLGTAGAFSSG